MRQQRVMAVVLACSMLGVACGTGGDAEVASAPPPPAPPVADVSSRTPVHPDDGRYRFIVAPLASEETPQSRPDRGTEPGDENVHADPWNLPPHVLAQLPAGATLVFRGADIGYEDDRGEFVVIAGAGSGFDSLDTPAEDQRSAIDILSEMAAVERIAPVGDGTYSVVTTDPAVFDGLDVSVQVDVPLALTDDPLEVYQWALHNDGTNLLPLSLQPMPLQVADADLDGVEALTDRSGRGVTVAVVDSGVDFGHPDLVDASWVNADEICDNGVDDDANGYVDDCSGWDFANDDNRPFSSASHPHGTHVAGIIAASRTNDSGVGGLAPGVRIMDLNVAATSSGDSILSSSIARAIRYAVDNGADVVNLSLGTAPGVPEEAVAPIAAAASYANDHDVLLVAAAGNDGIDLGVAPVYPASLDLPNVLVVGASSPGESVAFFSNHGQDVDLFAPGELILSTVPGGDHLFMSGTSQSAPLVTAAAALYLEADPTAVPTEVVTQLVGTGDEHAAYAATSRGGVRVNAARALGLVPDAGMDKSNAHVVIRGLDTASEDGVHADIEMTVPGGQFNQPFHWEGSIVALVDGAVYGIIDHPVDVEGASITTDGRGSFLLADSDAVSSSVDTILPPGMYGLVVEAVPRTDPTVRLGRAAIATFEIGGAVDDEAPDPADTSDVDDPAEDPTDPGDGPGSSPDPADPTEVDPQTPASPPVDESTPQDDPDAPSSDAGDTGGEPDTSDGAETPGIPPTDPTPEDPATSDPVADDPVTEEPAVEGPVAEAPGVDEPAVGADPTETDDPPPTDDGFDEVAWDVTSVTPRSGPVMTETLVSLTGFFPKPVEMWFGDQAGVVVFQSESVLLVTTPRAVAAAVVDLDLHHRTDGIVLHIPDGFEFLAEGENPTDLGPLDPESAPPIDDAAPPGGPTDPADVPDPGDQVVPIPDAAEEPVAGGDVGEGDGTPDDGWPDDGSPGDGSSGDADETDTTDDVIDFDPDDGLGVPDVPATGNNGRETQRQARADVVGDPVDLGNGITGVPLEGLSAIGGVPACDSNPCRSRRVGG